MTGAIEILCDEIKFDFQPEMESSDLLVSFVAVLVDEIRCMRDTKNILAEVTGVAASEGSGEVLALADEMLEQFTTVALTDAARIAAAAAVHHKCREVNPEDQYPTDHLVNMLSGCASAVRFGLEKPCRSRHAAEAASHVWAQKYGVNLFDSFTPNWERDWARAKMMDALKRLEVVRAAARALV